MLGTKTGPEGLRPCLPCASAWDVVEELSAEKGHEAMKHPEEKDPLEKYCKTEPDADVPRPRQLSDGKQGRRPSGPVLVPSIATRPVPPLTCPSLAPGVTPQRVSSESV